MKQELNYNRIENSVDLSIMQKSHIVIVGAGGSYSLAHSLVRSGIGKLTVIDFDTVEDSNIARQGYLPSDIGTLKVEALEKSLKQIRPDLDYVGIPKKLQDLTEEEKENTFSSADLILNLTDSFEASAYGNKIALEYDVPAIWAGWYLDSRTAEIIIVAPQITTACYRCIASSRYESFEKGEILKNASTNNTMFHSQLLDSMVGQIGLGLLHYPYGDTSWIKEDSKEAESFIKSLCSEKGHLEYNVLQFKHHPLGGNKLFDRTYGKNTMSAACFMSYWQKVGPELKSTGYPIDCPDCQGKLLAKVEPKNVLHGFFGYNNPLKNK